jgi:hypothetical protein
MIRNQPNQVEDLPKGVQKIRLKWKMNRRQVCKCRRRRNNKPRVLSKLGKP